MAPERYISDTGILTESERIAAELLDTQTMVNEHSAQALAGQVAGVRQRLGYDSAEEIDLDGMVDVRIVAKSTVVTPRAVAMVLPLTETSKETTDSARQAATGILERRDDRLLAVVGPCSIHDTESAMEYARWIAERREEFGKDLEIMMRAYFEKPRTEVGWKGFTYDPYLDGSNRFSVGLVATRMLLCRITDMGVPVATEPLNALTPQYVDGLVAYNGVGARSVTDQTSRERASGVSPVVGFKNTPEGSKAAAVSAVVSARSAHDFLGIDVNGMTSQITTSGNLTAHPILRGASTGPNYTADHIAELALLMEAKGLLPTAVVDVSHDNSGKNPARQIEGLTDVARQVAAGQAAIRGVMIESHLMAGRQPHDVNQPRPLEYGVSITDGCVDLGDTAEMLAMLADASRQRRALAA